MTDFGITVPRPFADLSDLELFAIHNQLRWDLKGVSLETAKRLAAIKVELNRRGCLDFSECED